MKSYFGKDMKDYTLSPHCLEDKIVEEGIEGIENLKEIRDMDGHICGGMAVSSYLPIEKHRETIDLDFSMLWGGTTTEYKELVQPLFNFFEDRGYDNDYNRGNSTHNIFIENGDSLLIQHKRISSNFFSKIRKSLEREMSNGRRISKDDINYKVMSPEDLVSHKISRTLKIVSYNDLDFPENKPLEDFKRDTESLRDRVVYRGEDADPKEVSNLRVFYDLYDIRSLAENVGLNENYMREVIDDLSSEDCPSDDFRRFLDRYNIETD